MFKSVWQMILQPLSAPRGLAALLVICLGSSQSALYAQRVAGPTPSDPAAGPDAADWGGRGAEWSRQQNLWVARLGGQRRAIGALTLNRAYEDAELRFAFAPCAECRAGVLFRMTTNGNRTTGTYVSLSADDLGVAYRLTLDAKGQELERTPLPKQPTPPPVSGAPPPIDMAAALGYAPFVPKVVPGDWNRVVVAIRSDGQGSFLGGNINSVPLLKLAHLEVPAGYGPIAILVTGPKGANTRFKDLSVEDLTMRVARREDTPNSGFKKKKLTDLFYSEGAAIGDLNHDGIPDIVAGAFYYLGPDYSVAREIYPSKTFNPTNNSDTFMSFVYDFNGDGWGDVLTIHATPEPGWPAVLYINPRGVNRHWDRFVVVPYNTAETVKLVDIDGDGRPELVFITDNRVGYAKYDPADPTKPWVFHPVSERGHWGSHAIGVGDVNGDGRLDILQANGWWEQPASSTNGTWKFHAVPFGGGADLLVYDVNGDGVPDVISSVAAHGWGLAWFEQKRHENAESTWERHMIMGYPSELDQYGAAFSQLHALVLADMDGDGVLDIVTGKRWWGHGDHPAGDTDPYGESVLYWFKLVRQPGGQVQFVPHLIDNNSGIGTQIAVGDLDGNGTMDIVTSTRKGTFVFLNQMAASGAAKSGK